MDKLTASQFGIVPEKDVTRELSKMLEFLKSGDCRKVVFDSGVYYIDAEKCREYMLHITNTIADSELSPDETPHLNAVAFHLDGLENVTLDGNGATFLISGKCTNIVFLKCKNVTLKNIELRHISPDMHCLRVTNKGKFHVDFESDRETKLEFEASKPYFVGKGYRYPVDKNAATARWIPRIREAAPDFAERVKHPLCHAVKYRETDGGFRAYYPTASRFCIGDSFYIYEVRRRFAGIFIDRSENIKLENVRQRFNYSLAVVAQCSENVELVDCTFAPEKDSPRQLSSCADFVQACMCRGEISVSGCEFVGAGDDCLNVHGVHFRLVDIGKDCVTVRFMHPQTHGFDPFKKGDKLAVIDPKSLLEKGTAQVVASRLLNETDIHLELCSLCGEMEVGDAIEDVSACPKLDFHSNKISRIVTRGVLVTTREKVEIKENFFNQTAMSAILISDDARSWFESGRCLDVTIEGNRFLHCGQPTILIKPENAVDKGAVHKNIRIIGNDFNSKLCLRAHSADGIIFEDNSGVGKKAMQADRCEINGNKY